MKGPKKKKVEEELILTAVIESNVLGFIAEKNKFLGVLKLIFDESKPPLDFYLPLGFVPTAVIISRTSLWEKMKGAIIKIKMRGNNLVGIGHPIKDLWITDKEIKEFYKEVEKQQKMSMGKQKEPTVEKEVKKNDGKTVENNQIS